MACRPEKLEDLAGGSVKTNLIPVPVIRNVEMHARRRSVWPRIHKDISNSVNVYRNNICMTYILPIYTYTYIILIFFRRVWGFKHANGCLEESSLVFFPESFSNIWLGLFYCVVLSIKGCLEVSIVVVTLYVILSGKWCTCLKGHHWPRWQ